MTAGSLRLSGRSGNPPAFDDVFSFAAVDSLNRHELILVDDDQTVLSTVASLPTPLPLGELSMPLWL